jgi:aryl-alcohol dehydrogenase-like predicted oxidoreductase
MYTRRTFLTSTAVAAATTIIAGCGRTSDESAVTAAAPSSTPESSGIGKRRVGRSDISISPLVLGGNVFGWTADRDRSFEILDRFVDAGFETIDTADVYSSWAPGNRGGESETIIGEWMRSRGNRDRIIVITKVGGEMDGHKGLSAANIQRAAEASLKRLQTDYIDIYFSHFPDPATPHEETLAAYQKLIDAGKVRIIGASNFSGEQLRQALDVAAANKLPRYEILQPRYNLYDRNDFEGPLKDIALAEELGVITYSSLASGFLSGKYRSEADLGQSPRGGGVKRYLNERGLRILDALDAVARRHNAEPADVALAWVIRSEGVTAPIASATSVEQLDTLVRAPTLAAALTEEDMEQLNQASAAS